MTTNSLCLVCKRGRKILFPKKKYLHQSSLALFSKRKNSGAERLRLSRVGVELVSFINDRLEEFNVKPAELVLEITETALFDCCGQTIKSIKRLNAMGCQLALDDFGTCYSSLSHLLTFPIDIVKLDKSTLPVSAEKARHMSIVRGMAAMAKIVDLNVIAEGVENSFHFLLCKDLEISEDQGYFFGRPESSKDIEERWLNKQLQRQF